MKTPDPAPQTADAVLPAPAPAAEPVLTDYADLGTAFGLDASVASGMAASPAGVAAGGSDGATAKPWEYRLTRRTGL